MHGYALKHALSPALPRKRLVNDGILYPLLAKMEKAGLIRKKMEPGGKAPNRYVLHPTEKGRNTFFDWLRGPAMEEDEVTYDFFVGHPFLIKCTFFKHLSRREVRAKLAAQRDRERGKLEAFERIREGMVERKVDAFRVAILDLGMAQQRDRIAWLDQLTKNLGRAVGARKRS